MSVEVKELAGGAVCDVTVSGKLDAEDYAEFVPHFERLIEEHGKLRFLFRMQDFEGWTLGAAWQDLKFDVKHCKDIERLAFVCETSHHKFMEAFCKLFSKATTRFFDYSEAEEAEQWVLEDLCVKSST